MLNLKELKQPIKYADQLGRQYIANITKEHQKKFAQYFTPSNVAEFMGNLAGNKGDNVKILDPGAGVGVLSCALCESLLNVNKDLKKVELEVYEDDFNVIPYLRKSLENLKCWFFDQGIELSYIIHENDFVVKNGIYIDGGLNFNSSFDYVIANPPFFKLNKMDPRAQAAASVVHGQPNIYALFMTVSAAMLKKEGELIYIVPRSFTAGPYFRLFREWFFSKMCPEFVHLFNSRKEAFNRDAVLQENLIIKAIRDDNWSSDIQKRFVSISLSNGTSDLSESNKRIVPLEKIIDMSSQNKVVFLPTSKQDDEVISIVQSWKGDLESYGFKISTGPVVPFRATDLIDEQGDPHTHVPLIWMQHLKTMTFQWPVNTRKPQYIKLNELSKRQLVPNKNYVFLRRFTSKEEDRRLSASPYISETLKVPFLGLENHLNYIYRLNGELSKEEAFGLSIIYNSRLLDSYFRIFNGNTQVSATEIKNVPLPPLDSIRLIGKEFMNQTLDSDKIDNWIKEVLLNPNSINKRLQVVGS